MPLKMLKMETAVAVGVGDGDAAIVIRSWASSAIITVQRGNYL